MLIHTSTHMHAHVNTRPGCCHCLARPTRTLPFCWQHAPELPQAPRTQPLLGFPVNAPCARAAVRCVRFLPLSSPSSRRGPPPRARHVQVSRGERKTASAPVSISWQADGERGGGGSEGERAPKRERERETVQVGGGREWGSAWIKMQPDAQLFVILLSPTPSRTD